MDCSDRYVKKFVSFIEIELDQYWKIILTRNNDHASNFDYISTHTNNSDTHPKIKLLSIFDDSNNNLKIEEKILNFKEKSEISIFGNVICYDLSQIMEKSESGNSFFGGTSKKSKLLHV